MRELALHILDIVQNSVAAGANVVEIAIEEETAMDRLVFRITDNGRGMDAATVLQVTDPFYTTRTTRRVGLGLPMVKTGSEACDGGLKIDSRVGEGTEVEAAYRLSHIDRPPLGDMVATMLAILLGNEAIDFRYSHNVDGRVFDYSSREMKEILEDVSFQTPAVYAWLSEFMTEGEAGLRPDGQGV